MYCIWTYVYIYMYNSKLLIATLAEAITSGCENFINGRFRDVRFEKIAGAMPGLHRKLAGKTRKLRVHVTQDDS